MTSYSYKVKNEIYSKMPTTKLEALSELFAIFSLKNSISSHSLIIRLENTGIAKRVYSLLKFVCNLKIETKFSTSNIFGMHNVYTLSIHRQKGYSNLLADMKFSFVDILNNEEIFRGYLRGVFLLCGYIKDPKKEYALDFFIDEERSAMDVHELLIKKSKKAFKTRKKNKYLVYLRNSEDIMDMLVNFGAITHFFAFEETTMIKELKNKTIREMNWEVANETKTLNTANNQMKMINLSTTS